MPTAPMQLRQPCQRTFANRTNVDMLLPAQQNRREGARLEERNIMGELNMYRQLGLKPSFSEIGRRYGLDRHTVARYWNEGGDVDDGRCNRPSGFDAHSALIAEKAAMPGATKKAVHEYLLHRCGGAADARVQRLHALLPQARHRVRRRRAARAPSPGTRPLPAGSCSSTGRRTCA